MGNLVASMLIVAKTAKCFTWLRTLMLSKYVVPLPLCVFSSKEHLQPLIYVHSSQKIFNRGFQVGVLCGSVAMTTQYKIAQTWLPYIEIQY